MSRIRVYSRQTAEGAIHGHQTVVELDGQELRGGRSIDLHASVDSAVTATVEMFASDAFEWDADAKVTIHLTVLPGYTLDETQLPDGGRRLTARRL